MKKKFSNFWNTMLFRDLFKNQTYTRKLNSSMGLLGFLGFLGCLGFLKHELLDEIPFAFIFFGFFGFFGFYFEGKMSNILMDERYWYNRAKAEAISSKIFMLLVHLVTILSISYVDNALELVGYLIAIIGLSFGLSIFLSQYLLYKFENEE